MNPLRKFKVTELGMKRLRERAMKPTWKGPPCPGSRMCIAKITGLSMSTVNHIICGMPVGENTAAILAHLFGPESVVEQEPVYRII